MNVNPLIGEVTNMEGICRDRLMELPASMFDVFSCSMCYHYLFHASKGLKPTATWPWPLVPTDAGRKYYHENVSIIADVRSSVARALVCESLNDNECTRWIDCCNAAAKCCQTQLSEAVKNFTSGLFCPRTWDGFGCFDDAGPSTRNFISCPSYVEHASISATAYKDCTENGTWWVDSETSSEWTNYTTCVQTQDYQTVVYVAFACNILSLALLVPACVIFLGIRQLRAQKRIKLHLCLFLSFIFACIVTLIWDVAVYLDRLHNRRSETVMHRNSDACKLLYILTRYVSTANFFWMFCEGFYLHRLIVHAFSTPKSLMPYYVFGWLISWIPSIIYAIVRASNEDYNRRLSLFKCYCNMVYLFTACNMVYLFTAFTVQNKYKQRYICWVYNIDTFEWLLYTPNMMCVLANVVFLANILKILCSKLQAHPNEPSNYRKALKATFVLIPLFGLQQFIVIYRPPPTSSIAFAYEVTQTVITNTQGAIVALIFCFLNGEVHTFLRSCLGTRVDMSSVTTNGRANSLSSATQITSFTSGSRGNKSFENNDKGYIPLSTSITLQDNSIANKSTNGRVSFAILTV